MSTSRKYELKHLDLIDELHYDCGSGIFTWAKRASGRVMNKQAGSVFSDGYRQIYVLGCRYPAHWLAWFYVYKKWPLETLDRINNIRSDNSIANLRLATYSQNCQNRKASKTSSTKIKGIRFKKNRWEVSAQVNNKRKYLGRFKQLSEAIKAHSDFLKPLVGDFYNI